MFCNTFLRFFDISIHVPRVEDDYREYCVLPYPSKFQSTSPVWRTTEDSCPLSEGELDFNPRPPCGGRPGDTTTAKLIHGISIHVPRVEDD